MIVTKIGGSIATDAGSILDEIARLDEVVLVHGFGPQTTRHAEEAGLEVRWLRSPEGVLSRFTDQEMLAVMEAAATEVAETLAEGLRERDADHRQLAGHAGLLEAEAKPALRHEREDGRVVLVRGNRSGRVRNVDPRPLDRSLADGQLPLVTPLARDEEGIVSVDADRAAAAIAARLDADALILFTDVARLLDADHDPIEELPTSRIPGLLEAQALSGGMLRKLVAAREALEGGVDRSLIADGTRSDPVTQVLEGDATEVVKR
jgi:acetylglutamate/LysW-gamma-L-alpha-aminoadipate kinase